MNESSRRYKKFHIDVCRFWLSYLVPYQAKERKEAASMSIERKNANGVLLNNKRFF